MERLDSGQGRGGHAAPKQSPVTLSSDAKLRILLTQDASMAGCPSWVPLGCSWPDAETTSTKPLRSHCGSRLGTGQG